MLYQVSCNKIRLSFNRSTAVCSSFKFPSVCMVVYSVRRGERTACSGHGDCWQPRGGAIISKVMKNKRVEVESGGAACLAAGGGGEV